MAFCIAGRVRADRSFSRPIARGVILKQILQDSPRLIVTSLEADLGQPGVSVGAGLGRDDVEDDGPTRGREAVAAYAARVAAAGAVNADFFAGGAPVGLCIRDGELITLPYPHRAVCAILRDRRLVFDIPEATASARVRRTAPASPDTPTAPSTLPLSDLNRSRGVNGLVLYTPAYGPKTLTNGFGAEVVLAGVPTPLRPGRITGTVAEVRPHQGATPLGAGRVVLSGHGPGADFLRGLRVGDAVEIDISLRSRRIPDWGTVRDAVGGGPFLVRGGEVDIDAAAERFQPDVLLGRSPRTAVGVTRDGRLLLVAVDGRQPLSQGMTLAELAALMERLGCETAMNLDGGGSTTMAAAGVRVNSPSDGWERSVAEMLLVRAAPLASDPPDPPSDLPTDPDPPQVYAEIDGPVASGQSVPFELRDGEGEPVSGDHPIVWGIEGPIGFIDQSGLFTAGKAGTGRVVAMWGDRKAATEVRVIPGTAPSRLASVWSPPDPARPQQSRLTVTVYDASGNAIPGIVVDLALPVAAGSADALSRPTDATGAAVFDIAWSDRVPRRLKVKAGPASLSPPDAPPSSPAPASPPSGPSTPSP